MHHESGTVGFHPHEITNPKHQTFNQNPHPRKAAGAAACTVQTSKSNKRRQETMLVEQKPTASLKSALTEHYAEQMAPHLMRAAIDLDDAEAVARRLSAAGFYSNVIAACQARAVDIARHGGRHAD